MYLVGIFDPSFWAESPSKAAAMGQAVGGIVVGGLYNLLGPLALAALILLGTRYWPKGMLVVAAACVVYTMATSWSLISLIRDEDSTAALLLLFLPIVLGGLLIPFTAAAALVHWLRSRTPLES